MFYLCAAFDIADNLTSLVIVASCFNWIRLRIWWVTQHRHGSSLQLNGSNVNAMVFLEVESKCPRHYCYTYDCQRLLDSRLVRHCHAPHFWTEQVSQLCLYFLTVSGWGVWMFGINNQLVSMHSSWIVRIE